MGVYFKAASGWSGRLDEPLLAAAVASAFAGAALGNRYLKKLTMKGVQRIVAGMLAAVALGLIGGFL
jgi:uncharacterized membrane protein YfcA